jgi:hypothetical protein
MTALQFLVSFIQSDLAKGLLVGGLIVAFLPLLGNMARGLGKALSALYTAAKTGRPPSAKPKRAPRKRRKRQAADQG